MQIFGLVFFFFFMYCYLDAFLHGPMENVGELKKEAVI